VANVITYRSRSAFRDVAKVMGFSPSLVDYLAGRLSYRGVSHMREELAVGNGGYPLGLALGSGPDPSAEVDLSSEADPITHGPQPKAQGSLPTTHSPLDTVIAL